MMSPKGKAKWKKAVAIKRKRQPTKTDEVKHDKDCHLGDNWKQCPACLELHL